MATSVKKKTYGFTLTEIAIILGIVGMVLGVIWISAATLYTNMRIASSNRQLILITQAVRSIYATSVTIAAADGVAITGSLIPAGIFPADTLANGLTSTVVNSAWSGGYINVYAATMPGSPANTGDAFVVQFEGIPSKGCINLLTALTGITGRDPGMAGATGSNTASANTMLTNFTNLILTNSSLPATVAATACGSSDISTVSFQFRLHD